MANFVGNNQDFHNFLGPRIRNAINNLTRKSRKQRNGVCEECDNEKELHSAHVHGKGRRKIIESVLRQYTKDGIVRCDLEEVESKILEAHKPIEKTFRFLCHKCHVEYDSQIKTPKNRKRTRQSNNREINTNEFNKLNRIRLWSERPKQNNHKLIKAYLTLEKEGDVILDKMKSLCSDKSKNPSLFVENFDAHYASMKTDASNSHGKVFYDENQNVSMWPVVRKEVRKYFEVKE